MKKSRLLIICLITIYWVICHPPQRHDLHQPAKPASNGVQDTIVSRELRGVWITRFDWAPRPGETIQEKLQSLFKKLAEANFNTVFFQVRAQADVLYPSPYEPWSPLVQEKNPGCDPLLIAIEEAHRQGLQFHAYVNLLPLWGEANPPHDTTHLFYHHGPQVEPGQSWVCFTDSITPMKINEYYYLNPAIPQVKSYLKKIMRHLTMNYDMDGIHFDRVRYPGSNYLNDPYSKKQYQHDSLETGISREDWARNQLTSLVEQTVAEILTIKPYLAISCASWGLYRTQHLNGYEQFRSGYDTYYQDAILWLERGIMDFIVPMTYWDMSDPKPNFGELWDEFQNQSSHFPAIHQGISAKKEWFDKGEIHHQIEYLRKNRSQGHVFFSYRGIARHLDQIKNELYTQAVSPLYPRTRQLKRKAYLIKLAQANQSNPYVSLKMPEPWEQWLDLAGEIGLILPDTVGQLIVQNNGVTSRASLKEWTHPLRYTLTTDGFTHNSDWFEIRNLPSKAIKRERFHLLAKTLLAGQTRINQDTCHLYRTGIFFSTLDLTPGYNPYQISLTINDTVKAFFAHYLEYQPQVIIQRDTFPLWIDTATIEPKDTLIASQDDQLKFQFIGSPGQQASLIIPELNKKILFVRRDFNDYSLYQLSINSCTFPIDKPIAMNVELTTPLSHSRRERLVFSIPAPITIFPRQAYQLLEVKTNHAILNYEMGQIRLGGPIRAELDSGIILKSNGRTGELYRIILDEQTQGFIHQNDIRFLPSGYPIPEFYINSIIATAVDSGTLIIIPYPEPVPYEITPNPDGSVISVTLYGAKTNSTWIIHRTDLPMVKQLSWEQRTPSSYTLNVHLKNAKLWGYRIYRDGANIKLFLRSAPALTMENGQLSMKGLHIALEAGHGGTNSGAIGLSGLLEKDINLALTKEIEKICIQNGLKVTLIRPDDREMALNEKRDDVEKSSADLFISIHANASSTANGFLGVKGASTYYHNIFWHPFAQFIYQRLLTLELAPFGVVGSFNYKPIRMSSRPAILVEQAFMSQAEDEEKLADPVFRQKMAHAIFQGIKDYVFWMFDQPAK